MVDPNHRKKMLLEIQRKALDNVGLRSVRPRVTDTADQGIRIDPPGQSGKGFVLSGSDLVAGDDTLFRSVVTPVCMLFAHGLSTTPERRDLRDTSRKRHGGTDQRRGGRPSLRSR